LTIFGKDEGGRMKKMGAARGVLWDKRLENLGKDEGGREWRCARVRWVLPRMKHGWGRVDSSESK
jgi:hypothetical protein